MDQPNPDENNTILIFAQNQQAQVHQSLAQIQQPQQFYQQAQENVVFNPQFQYMNYQQVDQQCVDTLQTDPQYAPQQSQLVVQPANDSFTISFNTVPQEKKQKKSKKSRRRDRHETVVPYQTNQNNTITFFGQQPCQQVQQEDCPIYAQEVAFTPQEFPNMVSNMVQFVPQENYQMPLPLQVPSQQILQMSDDHQLDNLILIPQAQDFAEFTEFHQPQFMQSGIEMFDMQTGFQPVFPVQNNNIVTEYLPTENLAVESVIEEVHVFEEVKDYNYQNKNMQSDSLITIDVQHQMMPAQQYQTQQDHIMDEPKAAKILQFNIMQFYKIKKRSLSFQLDPEMCRYQGQLTFELDLSVDTLKEFTANIQSYKSQGYAKMHIEAKFICKQAQIVEAFLLKDQDGVRTKLKQLSLRDQGLNRPEDQAFFQCQLQQQSSRNLFQHEQKMKQEFTKLLEHGTTSLNKKIFSIRLKNAADLSKYKQKYLIMVSFFCGQLTDIGGVRKINYQRDREENQKNNASLVSSYFVTNDHCGQSECWLPRLVASLRVTSPWSLNFVVPKDYMLIASGKQIIREVDSEGLALHEYEISEEDQTIPDKIGFIALPMPQITPIELSKSNSKLYACFASKQRQHYLSPKLVPEIIDFISSILQRPYPCKETQIVFVPNLFPLKNAQQSLNFADGLHILDQEILFRPNQIDKRHHCYKNLTSSLTYDYYGNKVREMFPSDLWLIVAIRERLGDRFKKKKCGTLLYRYQIMRSIEKLYKQMKYGLETSPLQTVKTQANEAEPDEVYRLGYCNPAEQTLNDIFYRKSALIMHMIESNIDELNLDKIYREMYQEAISVKDSSDRMINEVTFRKKFRKVCGMQPQNFFTNWIWSTSCPQLELSYEFNKRNNSLDLQLKQSSASSFNMKQRKNLETKLNKIFGASSLTLNKELNSDPPTGMDTFFVDQSQAQRRWFVGDINIVIYQVEGSGGDILKQQHKMPLKDFKTSVSAHIPLQGKVKRTMPTKKKDFDYAFQDLEQQNQQQNITASNAHMQAAQMVLNNDVWKFEMNEFELEDFPLETKNIFTTRELENNPVLWIRVDPDMEYIRKIKVMQDKKIHWLFQLLRENDIIGQIEAINQLHKFNSELVYEILKTISRNENFFFKVRKCVLKALQKMEISQFNKWLSHEAFLIRSFNKRNFDEVTGFYRVNNFTNLLEYYLDRSLLKAISKCKEEKLVLKPEKHLELQELRKLRDKIDASMFEDARSAEKLIESDNNASATIQLNIIDNQLVNVTTRAIKKPKLIEESLYRVTSETVAKMLIKVLEQNDNGDNSFDDSFLIKDLFASLGKLDNLQLMPKIASEILRQFKLDQISNSSPQHAITIGCIKAYFNMQKQIWRFKELKLANLEASDKVSLGQAQLIEKTEQILDVLKAQVHAMVQDPDQSLILRLFIFNEQVKNIVFHKNLPLVKALQAILEAIYNLQAKLQIRFAFYCLKELAMFLENKKFVGKINFTEMFIESQSTRQFMDTLWQFMLLPHGYLTHELSYWVKRIIQRIYGKNPPQFLQTSESQFVVQNDRVWSQTEQKLAQEEQQRLSQKEQQKTNAVHAEKQDIIVETPLTIHFQPNPNTSKRQGLRSQISEIIVHSTQDLVDQNMISLTPDQKMKDVLYPNQMALNPSIFHQMDYYQRGGPLGGFDMHVGDNIISMNNDYARDNIITLQPAIHINRRDSYNSDEQSDAKRMEFDQKSKHTDQMDYDDEQNDLLSETEYDPFAQEKYDDPVVQACWLVLGELYYHYDVTDFLEPVSGKTIGEDIFEEYCEMIKNPMDIGTVMRKMQANAYAGDMSQFIADVELIFDNCRDFNEQGTEIYNSANKLTEFFKKQLQEKGLIS